MRRYGSRGRRLLAHHRVERRRGRAGLHRHDETFAAEHPDRAGFIQSLGIAAVPLRHGLRGARGGNSSSGVVETPTFKVPTVNIGQRQAGRAICANVLCCDAEEPVIEAALRRALSGVCRRAARRRQPV